MYTCGKWIQCHAYMYIEPTSGCSKKKIEHKKQSMWIFIKESGYNKLYTYIPNKHYFSERICSARCSNPTVGDWRASANVAKVGLGCTVFSQVINMARKQSSMSLLFPWITSNVPGAMSSSRPMLYHFALAPQADLWILRRSLMPTEPTSVKKIALWHVSLSF